MSDAFAACRPRLFALAYRMLGSAADAEDVVQEAALRWHAADRSDIGNAEAWLVRAATRLSIDALRRRKRAPYVGPWLPEPLAGEEPVADTPVLAESLWLAFLLLLERLTPAERAAFLLRDVFDAPYDEVAAALGASESACRQHVSRARRNMASGRARFRVEPRAEVKLMTRFARSVGEGDMAGLVALLSPNAELVTDGGGKATAALNIIAGAEKVARFFLGLSRKVPPELIWSPMRVNGAPGVLMALGGEPYALWSFATDGERITGLFAQRNPDKLGRFDKPATGAGPAQQTPV